MIICLTSWRLRHSDFGAIVLSTMSLAIIYNAAELMAARLNGRGFRIGFQILPEILISGLVMFIGIVTMFRNGRYNRTLWGGAIPTLLASFIHVGLLVLCSLALHAARRKHAAKKESEFIVVLVPDPLAIEAAKLRDCGEGKDDSNIAVPFAMPGDFEPTVLTGRQIVNLPAPRAGMVYLLRPK